jgi:uncharacterized membrane protein
MILYLIGGVVCALSICRKRRLGFWLTVFLILIWPLPLCIGVGMAVRNARR